MDAYAPFSNFLCGMAQKELSEQQMLLAKNALIDTAACMIGGLTEAPLSDLLTLPQPGKRIGATILGYGTDYAPSDAALYNGIASHILDLDDTAPPMRGHPSVVVLPAAFAIAEQEDSSGEDLLRAYLSGVEVVCQLGLSFGAAIHARGWHTTGVLGPIGAACASGFLLHLQKEQYQNAMGAAASLAGSLRANFGTLTKPLHVGDACRNGVLCALMVQKGLTSSPLAFNGTEGLVSLFSGLTCPEEERQKIAARIGNPLAIEEPGFIMKAYPSCSSNHRALEALQTIGQKHPLRPQDIARIEAHLGIFAIRELVSPQPKTGVEARFSPGFHFALALLGLPICQSSFCDEMVQKEAVQEIIRKTVIVHHPPFDFVPNLSIGPAKTRVILHDGTVYEEECWYPLGHKKNPFGERQLWEKFSNCCEPVMGKQKTQQFYESLQNIEKEKSIRSILRATVGYRDTGES